MNMFLCQFYLDRKTLMGGQEVKRIRIQTQKKEMKILTQKKETKVTKTVREGKDKGGKKEVVTEIMGKKKTAMMKVQNQVRVEEKVKGVKKMEA